jgi:hypothetical protein
MTELFPETVDGPIEADTVYYGVEELRQVYLYLKAESEEGYTVGITNALEEALEPLAGLLQMVDSQWGDY